MSLENAILELAAALRYSADVSAEATRANTAGYEAMSKAYLAGGSVAGQFEQTAGGGQVKSGSELRAAGKPGAKDQELEQAVAKVEADAKKEKSGGTTSTAKEASPAAGLASDQAEVKKNAGAADTQTSTAENTVGSVKESAAADAAPLDYAKDVQPKLLAFIKAKGKEAFLEVLKPFGAANGTQLKPEQYAAVLEKVAA